MTTITPEGLQAIGARDIHWNRNWLGGYHEYWLPVTGDGTDRMRDTTLSVSFGDVSGVEFMAWIVTPHQRMALKHIKTIEQFQTMFSLLTGK